MVVSIPQAVGTIAILLQDKYALMTYSFNTASGRYYCNAVVMATATFGIVSVSIPQAVGTIAMPKAVSRTLLSPWSFQYRKR